MSRSLLSGQQEQRAFWPKEKHEQRPCGERQQGSVRIGAEGAQ